MQLLIVLSIVSGSGALFMLYKKAYFVRRSRVATGGNDQVIFDDIDNPVQYLVEMIEVAKEYIKMLFEKHIKVAMDRSIDRMAEVGHQLSSVIARKFIQLSNFIQGKRVLRNKGTTSLFIKDIAAYKDGKIK